MTRYLFTCLLACVAAAAGAYEVPILVRDTAYDYRCHNPATGEGSNHNRLDTAITTCQTKKQLNPGSPWRVIGGEYRVEIVETPQPPASCTGTWGEWSRVAGSETACPAGTRQFTEAREFAVATQPSPGGSGCPASPETRVLEEPCTPPPPEPVDCLGVWQPWERGEGTEGECIDGSRTFEEFRVFDVQQAPEHGGAACPVSAEYRVSSEACAAPPAGAVLPPTSGPVLSAAPNGRYLRIDGQPWYWVADTGWLMTRTSKAAITQYLEDRAARGVRLIHGPIVMSATGGDFNGVLVDRAAATLALSEPKMELLDWSVQEAGRLGLLITIAPVWGPDNDVYLPDVAKHVEYVTLLVQRYNNQAHVVWIPAGEFHKISRSVTGWAPNGTPIHSTEVSTELTPVNKARYQAVHDAIVAHRHPAQTIIWHPDGWKKPSRDWQTPTHLAYMLQSSNSVGEHVRGLFEEYAAPMTKPVINGESGYENSGNPPWHQRMFAWHTAFSGGAGYTYGHDRIWDFDPDWASHLGAEGASDIFGPHQAYMQRHHRESNVPAQSLVVGQGILFPAAETYVSALRSADGKTLHLYTGNGRNIQVNTAALAPGALTATWYDPRTGQESLPFDVQRGGNATLDPPGAPGVGNDWVATVRVSTQPAGTLSVAVELPSENIDGTPVRQPLAVLLSRRPVGGGPDVEAEAAYAAGVATVAGVTSGQYFVRARVRDAGGEFSEYSGEIQATVASGTGGGVAAIIHGRTFRKDLNNAPGPRDLTALGTLDWAYWGRTNATDFDSKSGGTLLNTVAKLTGSEGSFNYFAGSSAGQPLCSWTDGTPTATHSAERDIIYISTNVAGHGLKMTSGALGAGRKRFVFGWGAYQADIVVKAVLSDASAADHSYTVPSITSGQAWSYESHIVVEADDPAATLTFSLEATDTDGNINIQYAYVEDWPYEIVLLDTFTGTNGTAMAAHTPDTNPLSGNYVADRNSMVDSVPSPHNTTIQGNKFQLTASTAAVEFITGSRDNRIWVNWETNASSGHRIGISPSRDTVNDQQFWVNMREPNADYNIYREDGSQASVVSAAKTWGLSKNYALEVYRDGDTIQLRADGDVIATYTSATQVQGANGIALGVASITQAVLFDNLVVWRPQANEVAVEGDAAGSATGSAVATVGKPLVGPAAGASASGAGLSVAKVLAGSSAAAATGAGTPSVTVVLAGAAQSAASGAGTPSLSVPLTGAAPASSSATAAATVQKPVTGAATGSASASAALAVAKQLEGSAPAAASATAAITAASTLQGAATGVSTAAAAATVGKPLGGTAEGAASASAAARAAWAVAGQAQGQSTASAAASVSKPLEGHAASTAAAGGDLLSGVGLSGGAQASASASAGVSVTKAVAGQAAGAATATGTALVGKPLAGSGVGNTTAAADVSVGATLGGAAAGEATGSAGLSVVKAVSGQGLGGASAAGAATVGKALAGAAAGQSAAAAAARVAWHMEGAAGAVSAASGAAQVAKPLAGGSAVSATGAADLSVGSSLAGAAAGESAAAGGLSVVKAVAGGAVGQAAAPGTLSVAKGLAGAAAGNATGPATLAKVSTLAGGAAGSSAAHGAAAVGKALSGGVSAGQSAATGVLSRVAVLASSVSGQAAAAGSLQAGRVLAGGAEGVATAAGVLTTRGPVGPTMLAAWEDDGFILVSAA